MTLSLLRATQCRSIGRFLFYRLARNRDQVDAVPEWIVIDWLQNVSVSGQIQENGIHRSSI